MSVFACFYLVIDHEFHHTIVKVAADPWGDSRVDPQITLTLLLQNSLSITGQVHVKLISICVFLQYFNIVITKFTVNNRTGACKAHINSSFLQYQIVNLSSLTCHP